MAFCLLTSALFAAAAAVPTGAADAYCCGAGTKGGDCNDSDLTALNLAFNAAGSSLAIKATVDGSTYSCPVEMCKVASGTGAVPVAFPDIGKATDCLGKILAGAGAAPSDLTVTVTKGKQVHVSVQNGPDVTLKPCGSEATPVLETPLPAAGSSYCGGYQDIVKDLKIAVVNTTAVLSRLAAHRYAATTVCYPYSLLLGAGQYIGDCRTFWWQGCQDRVLWRAHRLQIVGHWRCRGAAGDDKADGKPKAQSAPCLLLQTAHTLSIHPILSFLLLAKSLSLGWARA